MAATPPVIVGFESGLEYWRKAWMAGNGSAEGPLGQVAPDALLEEFRVNPLLLEDFPFLRPSAARSAGAGRVAGLLGLDAPVSLVVDRPEKRASGSGVLARTWCRGLSQAMLAHVEENIYVCSPELVLLQLASELSYANLLDVAYELCGDFVRLGTALHEGRHLEEYRPLTSPERLAAVCGLFRHARGIKNARLVAKDVIANSWSPMESRLAALLSLPRSRGGFGCPKPVLNKRIYLPDELVELAGRGYVIPDVLYEDADLCLEYQGKQHGETSDRKRDDSKSNALLMMGIETVRVWDEQLCSPSAMGEIASYICKKHGVRLGPQSARMRIRQGDLMVAFKAMSNKVERVGC